MRNTPYATAVKLRTFCYSVWTYKVSGQYSVPFADYIYHCAIGGRLCLTFNTRKDHDHHPDRPE